MKQRLVGAIVLVALGVIFIPMILKGGREPSFIVNGSSIPAKPAEIKNIRQIEFATDDSSRTPDGRGAGQRNIRIPVDKRSAPLSEAVKGPAPASKEKTLKAKAGEESPGQTEQPVSPPTVKRKTLPAAPGIHAWAVQVGSFKRKNNAFKLRDKLRKQKYQAFVEGIRSGNATLIYRVRLGPYISRAGAKEVRDSLLARQKIKGLLVKHP